MGVRKDPLMLGLGLALLLLGGLARWSGRLPENQPIIPSSLTTPIKEAPVPDSPELLELRKTRYNNANPCFQIALSDGLTNPQEQWSGLWHDFSLIVEGFSGRMYPYFEKKSPAQLLQQQGPRIEPFSLGGFEGFVTDPSPYLSLVVWKTQGRALRVRIYSQDSNARAFLQQLSIGPRLDPKSKKFQIVWPLPD